MKKFILSFLVLYLSFSCKAQNNWGKVPGSLAMVSRVRADEVLRYFDTFKSPKLLYSVLDKDYYVLVKDEEKKYKEYEEVHNISIGFLSYDGEGF